MSQPVLDLTALVSDDKHIERHTLNTFKEILSACHELIKRYNKEQVKQMSYTVPSYQFGKPMYDVNVLTNYLLHHLADNGLYVYLAKSQEIFISWHDKDINIDKFLARKKCIQADHRNLITGMAAKPMNNIEALRLRQARQQQISAERNVRLSLRK